MFLDLLDFKMPGISMTVTVCLLWTSSRCDTCVKMRKIKFEIYPCKPDADLSSKERIILMTHEVKGTVLEQLHQMLEFHCSYLSYFMRGIKFSLSIELLYQSEFRKTKTQELGEYETYTNYNN